MDRKEMDAAILAALQGGVAKGGTQIRKETGIEARFLRKALQRLRHSGEIYHKPPAGKDNGWVWCINKIDKSSTQYKLVSQKWNGSLQL